MTEGVLGIIGCPMLEDNLIYCLKDDPDAKDIAIIDNENIGPLRRKLDSRGIPYRMVGMDDVLAGRYVPSEGRFNMLIYEFSLGKHAYPDQLKECVEDVTEKLQPYVDAIAFYLGTCGNYEWDIPKWCESKGYKPSAMFCDAEGNLCHDCVGVAIAGGPRYLQMERRYPGYLFMFPSMVNNYEEFMLANNRESVEATKNLTPEMMEILGIEPGQDGYMRWLLKLGHYEHMLKLDNGIGVDDADFDEGLEKLKARNHLDVVEAEPGWASTQPTVDLYRKCKRMLDEAHGGKA